MCNCAYYKINFTGLLKILIKLHKISAKGEYRGERGGEGECRGERETGKGKMEECRL